jgi:hypothetical protein
MPSGDLIMVVFNNVTVGACVGPCLKYFTGHFQLYHSPPPTLYSHFLLFLGLTGQIAFCFTKVGSNCTRLSAMAFLAAQDLWAAGPQEGASCFVRRG